MTDQILYNDTDFISVIFGITFCYINGIFFFYLILEKTNLNITSFFTPLNHVHAVINIDFICNIYMLQSCVNINQRLSRACIVHLVIKKNNWSYVKTMSCSGSHLGITINIKNTKFVKDLPMFDAQFRFNQCNSFREEYISVFSPYGPVLIL